MGYKVKKIYVGTQLVRPLVPATAISLNKSSITLTTAGQTSQLTATLTPSGSTSTVSWTSSNTSIATVSSSGLVTGVAPGSCTITATTDNGLTATCSVSDLRWVPGSNTIAYFPLESNATDIIHNITLTSQGTTNYTTVGGVKSAEFTKSNWLYSQSFSYVPQGDVAKTWSYWMYIKGANTGWQGIVQMGGSNAGECFGTGCYAGTSNILMTRSYSTSSTYTPTLNTWTNIIVTYSNSTWKLYANGTLQVTWSSTTAPTSGYSLYLGNNVNAVANFPNPSSYYGNLSNVILENKSWTATEISNYYNGTKSKYGL